MGKLQQMGKPITEDKTETKLVHQLGKKVLINPEGESRCMKKDFWDKPKGADLNKPFCISQADKLHIILPISNYHQETQAYMYDTERKQNEWHLTNERIQLIQIENNFFSNTHGAIIPMEGILPPNHGTSLRDITLTSDTHAALLAQCQIQTIKESRQKHAEEESEGSMITESLGEEETDNKLTLEKEEARTKAFNTCSDGSVYTHANRSTSAGYAAVKVLKEGGVEIKR